MELKKQIFAEYTDDPGNVNPLPFANVYSSDAAGNFIPDVFYTETDYNGFFNIQTGLPITNITIQWQGNKTTFTYSDVINASVINVVLSANELDPVIVVGERPNTNGLLYVIIGLLGLKMIS